MAQVLPSGDDFATAAVPMLPPPPARFSIMTVAPSRCCMCGWIKRAIVSVDPPGGDGTTILILPAGQFCALAAHGAVSAPRIRQRLGNMGLNILPEKLRLCSKDGLELGPVASRRRQPSTHLTVCDLLHLREAVHDRWWQIVLQKSPSRLCEIEICNNRIGASVLLNRCCSFVSDLESMFRDQMPKILLQHNRHKADMLVASLFVRFSNRPSGSSTFRLTTTPVSMSLRGSLFSADSAPRPFHHGDSKTRWTNLSGGLAVNMTAGPSGQTISPHPSSREGHHSTAGGARSPPIAFDRPRLSSHWKLPGPPE